MMQSASQMLFETNMLHQQTSSNTTQPTFESSGPPQQNQYFNTCGASNNMGKNVDYSPFSTPLSVSPTQPTCRTSLVELDRTRISPVQQTGDYPRMSSNNSQVPPLSNNTTTTQRTNIPTPITLPNFRDLFNEAPPSMMTHASSHSTHNNTNNNHHHHQFNSMSGSPSSTTFHHVSNDVAPPITNNFNQLPNMASEKIPTQAHQHQHQHQTMNMLNRASPTTSSSGHASQDHHHHYYYQHQQQQQYQQQPNMKSTTLTTTHQSTTMMNRTIQDMERELVHQSRFIAELERENGELRRELMHVRQQAAGSSRSNQPQPPQYVPTRTKDSSIVFESKKRSIDEVQSNNTIPVTTYLTSSVNDTKKRKINTSPSGSNLDSKKELSIVDESVDKLNTANMDKYIVKWKGETYVLVSIFKNRTQILNYYVPLYQSQNPDKVCKIVLSNEDYKQLSNENPETVEKKKHAWRVSVFSLDFYNFVKNFQKKNHQQRASSFIPFDTSLKRLNK